MPHGWRKPTDAATPRPVKGGKFLRLGAHLIYQPPLPLVRSRIIVLLYAGLVTLTDDLLCKDRLAVRLRPAKATSLIRKDDAGMSRY